MTTEEHAAQIKYLQSKQPGEMQAIKLRGLLDAVRDGSLTREDVLLYTDISVGQLDEMMREAPG